MYDAMYNKFSPSRVVEKCMQTIGEVSDAYKGFQSPVKEKELELEVSMRWVIIIVGIVIFSYQFAAPLLLVQQKVGIGGGKGYRDSRVGIIVWLFTAALLHTPVGSGSSSGEYGDAMEKHRPARVFISVFVLLLVTTHVTLASFTVIHHLFIWTVQVFRPRLAYRLWVPKLRSVHSFRQVLFASIFLSGTLSVLVVYCTLIVPNANNSHRGFGNSSIYSQSETYGWLSIEKKTCEFWLLPQFHGHFFGNNKEANFFGYNVGRLSLFESPIGTLWLSGIALFSMYYTLRRTEEINKRLARLMKKIRRGRLPNNEVDMKSNFKEAPENSEHDADSDNSSSSQPNNKNKEVLEANIIKRQSSFTKLTQAFKKTTERRKAIGKWMQKLQNLGARGWGEIKKRKGRKGLRSSKRGEHVARPKDFLPMSEWYSLALTDVAFQVFVSFQLFLDRFDMRMLQASIATEDEILIDEAYHNNFSREKMSSNREYNYPGLSLSIHPDSLLSADHILPENETLYSQSVADTERAAQQLGVSSNKIVHGVDTRFADLDEMWFDWTADTGDGGDSTYTIARSLAQPSLNIRQSCCDINEFVHIHERRNSVGSLEEAKASLDDDDMSELGYESDDEEEEGKETEYGKHEVEKEISLPRGELLLIGGDLAYPSATVKEYRQRLFRPFEYAMECPTRDKTMDISTGMYISKYHHASPDTQCPLTNEMNITSKYNISPVKGSRQFSQTNIKKMETAHNTKDDPAYGNGMPKSKTSVNLNSIGRNNSSLDRHLDDYFTSKFGVKPSQSKPVRSAVLNGKGEGVHKECIEGKPANYDDLLHEHKPLRKVRSRTFDGELKSSTNTSRLNTYHDLQVAANESDSDDGDTGVADHKAHPWENSGISVSSSSGLDEDGDITWNGPPCCYAIPGNHDWYDGLHTFVRSICHCDWIGGWRLPQQKSYFALQLPHGWWIFGLDYALVDDIDALQYQYFARIVELQMGKNDRIVLVSHEPTWLLDAYMNYPEEEEPPQHGSGSALNVKQLMRRHLRGRVALRIAGDIHNYIRHDLEAKTSTSKRQGAADICVVSGGGGAFLHPTHSFPERFYETGGLYSVKRKYPTDTDSFRVARMNLGFGFRRMNWKSDVVMALFYFLLVASFFPRCNLDHLLTAENVYPHGITLFALELLSMFSELFAESTVSLIMFIVLCMILFGFTEERYGLFRKTTIASLHVTTHVVMAFTLFLILELTVEVATKDGLAGRGYDSFFESFQSFEHAYLPADSWTSGLLRRALKLTLRVFDVPENMAWTRAAMCQNYEIQNQFLKNISVIHAQGLVSEKALHEFLLNSVQMVQFTRFDMLSYYIGNFLYLFVISTDVAASVFGLYLFICVNILNLHWNEAFSSIRYPHFKNFIRFNIDKSGNLHAFVIGFDKVAQKWKQDPNWSSIFEKQTREEIVHGNRPHRLHPDVASYAAAYPSRWISDTSDPKKRAQEGPKLVDYFCIKKKRRWVAPRRGNSVLKDLAQKSSVQTVVVGATLGKISKPKSPY